MKVTNRVRSCRHLWRNNHRSKWRWLEDDFEFQYFLTLLLCMKRSIGLPYALGSRSSLWLLHFQLALDLCERTLRMKCETFSLYPYLFRSENLRLDYFLFCFHFSFFFPSSVSKIILKIIVWHTLVNRNNNKKDSYKQTVYSLKREKVGIAFFWHGVQ